MSIFDHLSGLITDSFLCARSNFGDYPITASARANKRGGWGWGALCLVLIGRKSGARAQKRASITENYSGCVVWFPLISSE